MKGCIICDMNVYIELVIFNNFAVDLMLEVCTLTLKRLKIGKLRCVLGAAIGAAFATLYPLAPVWGKALIRALLAPLITLIFYAPKKGKLSARAGDIVGACMIFAALTFLTGGVATGASYLSGVDVNSYAALGFVALGVTACVLAARLIAFKRSSTRGDIRDAYICRGGKKIPCKALCDSGNLLVDPLSGLPVVIISDEMSKALGDMKKAGSIDVNTVGGNNTLPLVKLDCVELDGARLKALGAVSASPMGGFDVILQATMF